MEEYNPDPQDSNYENLHRYEWDFVALAIYYGQIEIITVLREGIKKEVIDDLSVGSVFL